MIERHKGIPLDGWIAFQEGFRRNQNPFLTVHMRAKWRESYMLAEAKAEPLAVIEGSGRPHDA